MSMYIALTLLSTLSCIASHTILPLKVRSYTTLQHSNTHLRQFDSSTNANQTVLTLQNCYSTDVSIPVTFATEPNNIYDLIFDTGSTTLGVVGSTCPTNNVYSCLGATPTYTVQPTTETITAAYGIGAFTGLINHDNVTVGSMTVTNLSFAVITQNNNFFAEGDCNGNYNSAPNSQGIIGFAYNSLALNGTGGWLDTYVQQQGIPNVFSISVPNNSVSIGAYINDPHNLRNVTIDQSQWYYEGELYSQFYTVSINDILVGNASIGVSSVDVLSGNIVDTGTNSIGLTTNLYNRVVTALFQYSFMANNFPTDYFDASSSDSCITQCDQNGNNCFTADILNTYLPTFTLVFNTGNTTIDIPIYPYPGYIYPVEFDDGHGNILIGLCSGISDMGTAFSAPNIIGLPFIGQFEQTYDRDNSILGFNPVMYPDIQPGQAPNITSYISQSATVSGGIVATTATPASNTTVADKAQPSTGKVINSSIGIIISSIIFMLI